MQKRCSTEINSVVDEETGLVKFCLLCFPKNVEILVTPCRVRILFNLPLSSVADDFN